MKTYTIEQYVELLREKADEYIDKETLEKALKENFDVVQDQFDYDYSLYQEGKITEEQFRNGVGTVLYNYYLLY